MGIKYMRLRRPDLGFTRIV